MLRRGQKINHFPGIVELTYKCRLAHHLNRMRKALPEAYTDWLPKTFILPEEGEAFAIMCNQQDKPSTFIVKPDKAAKGNGIFLTRKPRSIPRTTAQVVQQYIDNPLLIDGVKFDLRLYVLVTSFTPLRAYMHIEGLARFSTVPYQAPDSRNFQDRFMHLTNYSVNQHSENFVESYGIGDQYEEGASKRTVTYVRNWLDRNGFDSVKVWQQCREICWKTLLAIEPWVAQRYKASLPETVDNNHGFSCFQVLGLDILLDDTSQP